METKVHCGILYLGKNGYQDKFLCGIWCQSLLYFCTLETSHTKSNWEYTRTRAQILRKSYCFHTTYSIIDIASPPWVNIVVLNITFVVFEKSFWKKGSCALTAVTTIKSTVRLKLDNWQSSIFLYVSDIRFIIYCQPRIGLSSRAKSIVMLGIFHEEKK